MFLGKKYSIEIIESNHSGAKFSDNKLIVYKTENDDIEKIPDAKLISTIVDGEVVFSNNAWLF